MSNARTPKKKHAPSTQLPAPALTRGTIDFLNRAARQKKNDWLDRNREDYETHVRGPIHAIARHLKKNLAAVANGYHFPQQGLGRLKRTADSAARYGSPFRDYVTYTSKRPSKSRFDHNPSIFLMVYAGDEEGDEVLLAGGLYLPSSRQLRAIREAIAADATEFDRLFKSSAFARRFPGGFSDERKSKRPPRGFDPNHPRIEWLKHQGYFVWRSYKKSEYTGKGFGDLLAEDARQILRLNQLLERAIGGQWVSAKPEPKKKTPELLAVLDGIGSARRLMDF